MSCLVRLVKNCKIAGWQNVNELTHSFKESFFKENFFQNRLVYWTQIFRGNWNCYALSIFRVLVYFLASSENNKNILVRQKM